MDVVVGNIIVAVIALVGTFIGAYFSNRKTTALVSYRLEQLEKKVQAHNNLVERMYGVEQDIAVIKEDMKNE